MNRRDFLLATAAGAGKIKAQPSQFVPDRKTTALWLDANELIELPNGALVPRWRDKSPNGYDAVVPNGREPSFDCYRGSKPRYEAPTLVRSAINNRPALNFNSDHAQPICGEPAGPTTPGNNQTLILNDRGRALDRNVEGFTAIVVLKTVPKKHSNSENDYIFITHTRIGNTRFALVRSSSGTTNFHVRPADRPKDGDNVTGSNARGDSGWGIQTCVVKYGSGQARLYQYRNGEEQMQGRFDQKVASLRTSDELSSVVAIGSNTCCNFFNGQIAEIICFQRQLENQTFNDWHRHLMLKYGLRG